MSDNWQFVNVADAEMESISDHSRVENWRCRNFKNDTNIHISIGNISEFKKPASSRVITPYHWYLLHFPFSTWFLNAVIDYVCMLYFSVLWLAHQIDV